MILLIPLLLLLSADRCATVQIQPSPTVVVVGSSVGISVLITNCGDKAVRFTTETELFSACGEEIDLDYNYGRVDPGQGFYANTSYLVPPDACEGTWTIRTEARVGKTVAGEGEATFEVVNPENRGVAHE